MRQIVLDTETTGLEPTEHRIIEVGCVELVNRRLTGSSLHFYIQPDRAIDEGAMEVHGITNEFLVDKPRFGDIVTELMAFLTGAELVIHNAPFDVGFLNHELKRLGGDWGCIADHCRVLDTLKMARDLHRGQKNNLDALCKRYGIDNSRRELHGALLDAEILADVYLAMTGGQTALSLGGAAATPGTVVEEAVQRLEPSRRPLPVIRATPDEIAAHDKCLDAIEKASGGSCVFRMPSAQLVD